MCTAAEGSMSGAVYKFGSAVDAANLSPLSLAARGCTQPCVPNQGIALTKKACRSKRSRRAARRSAIVKRPFCVPMTTSHGGRRSGDPSAQSAVLVSGNPGTRRRLNHVGGIGDRARSNWVSPLQRTERVNRLLELARRVRVPPGNTNEERAAKSDKRDCVGSGALGPQLRGSLDQLRP